MLIVPMCPSCTAFTELSHVVKDLMDETMKEIQRICETIYDKLPIRHSFYLLNFSFGNELNGYPSNYFRITHYGHFSYFRYTKVLLRDITLPSNLMNVSDVFQQLSHRPTTKIGSQLAVLVWFKLIELTRSLCRS